MDHLVKAGKVDGAHKAIRALSVDAFPHAQLFKQSCLDLKPLMRVEKGQSVSWAQQLA